MSGGVGATGGTDILLPKEDSISDAPHFLPRHTPTRRFLSFRQLNALAVAVVLSATGLIPFQDVAFGLLSFVYLYFLSSFAFPSHSPASAPPAKVFGDQNLILSVYVSVGALIGLVLPIAYILHGFFEGDKEGIKAAAPHVFLLSCQVFMEGVTFSRSFSLPMRAFVPVFYNSKRLFAIGDWVRDEIGKEDDGEHGSGMRLMVGRELAIANLGFWAFNLFGFLLPVYLPRALKRYYYGVYGGKVKD